MGTRKGDWRDLLHAYAQAVAFKKLWLGLIGVLATVLIVIVTAFVYDLAAQQGMVTKCDFGHLAEYGNRNNVVLALARGRTVTEAMREDADYESGEAAGPEALELLPGIPAPRLGLGAFVEITPVLNPFSGNGWHLLISVFFYLALIRVWTYSGGAISRLAALEYARDDIPTLREALDMVRSRWRAYLLTPVIPLVGVLLFVLANMLVGLVGSVPIRGCWLLIPGYLGAAVMSLLATFLVVVGVLGFGLMMPVVSISGGEAFESWAAAYSYTLWGFGRLILYRALVWVIGIAAVILAALAAQVLLGILIGSVSMGMIGAEAGTLTTFGRAVTGEASYSVLLDADASAGNVAAAATLGLVTFLVRALVLAYMASYYFTANTIITFLLRKQVDRVEVEEVYIEEAPAQEAEQAAAGLAEDEGGEAEASREDEVTEDEPADEGPPPEEQQQGQ